MWAQLSDGLVALPQDARTRGHLEWVAAEVQAAGGTALLWRAEPIARGDEQRLVEDMSTARADEYRHLSERARGAEGFSGENRLLVEQLRRELRQIRRRDYFPPPEAELARQAVEELAATLTANAGMAAGGAR